MRATVAWTGDVRFLGSSDSGHSVAMDGPPELGGKNAGVRPMELMLLGVAGCTSFDVVHILRKGRAVITDCVTEIDAERALAEPKVFTRIHFHFRVTGRALDRRKVERAIALTASKYCSAAIMLERAGAAVTHDYEVIDAGESTGAAGNARPSQVDRPPLAGLRHVALHARRFDETLTFYRDLLGMQVEWRPDPDNVYLTSGVDNLAIHRADDQVATAGQRLDHIGFIVDAPKDVDRWHGFLATNGVRITAPPRTHRDGARSFYCKDPEGGSVQIIFHPPLAYTIPNAQTAVYRR